MKKTLLTFGAVVLTQIIIFPSFAYAQASAFDELCTGPGSTSSVCQNTKTTENPLLGEKGVITGAVQIMIIFAGVASVIMIMVGGFKYITSNGDPSKVSSAKDTILYSVIGLVITIMAQAIVSFVINRL